MILIAIMNYDYIKQGNCLELMKEIPNKSIDCIICDPPYGITSCEWDKELPFDELWDQYHRIIKDNGVIIIFGCEPFTSHLICSNEEEYKEHLIWVKNRGSNGIKSNYYHMRVHEDIIVFAKNGNHTFNPQKWEVPNNFIISRKTMDIVNQRNNLIDGEQTNKVRRQDDGSRFPISVLPFAMPYAPTKKSTVRNGDYRVHPTQKPLDLMEYLLRTYSNENDIVLDNCMGSGTTCVASIRNNRHYIGYELNDEYFKIAENRINEAKNAIQNQLFI